MKTSSLLASLVVGAVGTAASVQAGTIAVSEIGGGVFLNSGPMSPAVFGNDQTVWSHTSLIAANQFLHNSGISTNGKVTFVAADTTHGLSLMALFDDDVQGQLPISMGNIGMVTVANGQNLAYLNSGANNVVITPNGPGAREASGTVQWNSNGGGNGFAWAGLVDGNSMTWRFHKIDGAPLGLMDPSTFQFVTWTGTQWQVVPIPANLLSFTASNDWGFSATAIVTSVPLPAGGAMGGLALTGLACYRRRRSA